MGNGFPGVAVVSAIALLVVLGVGALILKPWAPDAIAPKLSLVPSPDVGLGDSAIVSRAGAPVVAIARSASDAGPRIIAAKVVVDEGESRIRLGVAPARVVASPLPGGPSQEPPQPSQSESTPAPQPAPQPAAVPVAATAPPVDSTPAPPARGAGGESPGPVAGGAGEGGVADVLQVCEGDDYTLRLSPVESEEGSGPPPSLAAHDLIVYFGSASEGEGFYLVLFDGQPVEVGEDPVQPELGRICAQIDLGSLLGESIEVGTEIRVEAKTITEALEPVVP